MPITKTSRILLLLLLFLTGMIAVSPTLLRLEQVGNSIANRMADEFHALVTVGQIQWHWLPVPHFSIRNTVVVTEEMELRLPETELHPNWLSLLSGRWQVDKVSLLSPTAHIKSLSTRTALKSIPHTLLIIEDGSLTLDFGKNISDGIGKTSLSLTGLNASTALQPDRIVGAGEATTSFADRIRLEGEYLPLENYFNFELGCEKLLLTKLITSLEPDIPAENPFNLKARFKGSGFDSLQAAVEGDSPSFVLRKQGKEVRLNCGLVAIQLEKSGDNFTLTVDKLKLKEPAATIRGVIKRTVPDPQGEGGDTPPSRWLLDLKGEDIDLGQVRQDVLKLWGGYEAADVACDVVRGGRAGKARFQFEGPAADFARIDQMAITVEVETADIHVPGAELDLHGAEGPIAIKQGYLTGTGLRASLGKSSGQNGILLLDLNEGGQAFHLDLDLEADLEALPPLLDRLINHQAFKDELHRFSMVQGKAKGHLHLGERLDQIETEVTVSEMKAWADYDRFHPSADGPAWPLEIHEGTLRVLPRQVLWQNIKGSIGPQIIHQTSGEISWQKRQPSLHIENLDASLDSSSLHVKLTENDLIPRRIADNLSSIGGQIELAGGTFRGLLSDPDSWRYKMDLKSLGLTAGTPRLPGLLFSEEIALNVNQEQLTLQKTRLRFLHQPLTISANLKHDNLTTWQGSVLVNGTVDQEIGSWLRQREWLPTRLFPRPPCTLHDFEISWEEDDQTTFEGKLTAGTGNDEASVELKIATAPGLLLIDRFQIEGHRQKAELRLAYHATQPPTLQFDWRGELEAATLETLLAHNILSAGRLSGILNIDTIDSLSTFSGSLTGKNLLLAWQPDTPPQGLDLLQMTGTGKRLLVDRLVANLDGDSIFGSGQLSVNEAGPSLSLDLTSPGLSMVHLSDMISAWDKAGANSLLKSEGGQKLTANINFDIDAFTTNRHSAASGEEDMPPKALLWHDVRGGIDIAPGQGTTLTVDSSSLCSMEIRGDHRKTNDSSHGNWLIIADKEPLPLFEEILPCLGVEQNMLEGQFSLRANLEGQPASWKKGTVTIKSSQGRILRMKLLSKVFSIVNITDLFDEQVPGISKKGFPYSQLTFEGSVRDNHLIIDKAAVHGEGLNMFVNGDMGLGDFDTKLTLLIAPLKTLDAIVAKVPLVGRVIGGEHGTIAAIPVGITGNIEEPVITVLPPEAIGEAALNVFKEALALPFVLLSPLMPTQQNK